MSTPTTLLTIQYKTKPLGAFKKKNQVNIIGISQVISMRWNFIAGSADGGCGIKAVDAIMVTHITMGSMCQGSALERSFTHKIQGAWRISKEIVRKMKKD